MPLLIGIAFRQIKPVRPYANPVFRVLNIAMIWAMLPIIVFFSIARYSSFNKILGFGYTFVLALIGLGVCVLLAIVLSFCMHFDRKKTTATTLNSAFMNVSYLGLPVVYALGAGGVLGPTLNGATALGPATLYAVAIAVPHLIFGVAIASTIKKKRLSPRFLLGNVVTFPAMFALIAALLFVGFHAPAPSVIVNIFDVHLAKPFSVLMILIVGHQMRIADPRKYASTIGMVGAVRFLVCPLVTYALIGVFGLSMATDLSPKPAMIMAIMPPAIFNLILAHKYKLDLKLYGATVTYLTFVSLFVALPLMVWLIF